MIESDKERLSCIYNALLAAGKVSSKGDFAIKLGRNRTGLSNAFSGRQGYLTDQLFNDIIAKFPEVNREFAMNGNGSVLNTTLYDETPKYEFTNVDKLLDAFLTQNKIFIKTQEQLDKSQEQIDKAQEQIDKLLEMISSLTKN